MCEVFERRFSLINSSHRYSTQPNYRSTPNYPTKTKGRVPLSLFVALRLFSRADTRSGVHITRFFQKSKNVRVCVFSPFRVLFRVLNPTGTFKALLKPGDAFRHDTYGRAVPSV